MRPASDSEQCFYCKQPVGDCHKPDCVLIRKTVKIRAIIEYEVGVPHSWAKPDIEYHRNDGSWCAKNMLDELKLLNPEGEGCLCDYVSFECLSDTGQPKLDET